MMASLIVDCAIRSIVIALGIGLVIKLLHIRRASTRHAAWTAVVVAMLLMPLWAVGGLRFQLPILSRASSIASFAALHTAVSGLDAAAAVFQDTGTDASSRPATPIASVGMTNWAIGLLSAYVAGAIVLLLRLLVGVLYARHLRRRATLREGRLTSDRCASPITIGWLAPAIILPADWQTWPPETLRAILEHEGEHARRRDPLVQALALVNRAVFWFHPLAWWLERRVTVLAEESCDAAVLAAGHSPVAYADTLLDVARAVRARGLRIRAVGMAMPGSNLEQRLRRILGAAPDPPLSRARTALTAALCAISMLLFATTDVTTKHADGVDAQTAALPKFDVVSVRPCALGAPGQTRGVGGSPITSTGRLYLQCYPLSTMVQEAYVFFADGRAHRMTSTLDVGVEGEPGWMTSERYTIEAVTAQTPAPAVMRGPMLQAVLEDRFKLKIRHETREQPIYELVIGKSGAKVAPYTGNDCVLKDEAAWPPAALPAGQRYCGDRTTAESDRIIRAGVMTLDELASLLNFDRPLVNKTGITAPVSFRFEYARSADAGTSQASIVAALRDRLGLEVHPSKGPRDFLVIEHAERPAKD